MIYRIEVYNRQKVISSPLWKEVFFKPQKEYTPGWSIGLTIFGSYWEDKDKRYF